MKGARWLFSLLIALGLLVSFGVSSSWAQAAAGGEFSLGYFTLGPIVPGLPLGPGSDNTLRIVNPGTQTDSETNPNGFL